MKRVLTILIGAAATFVAVTILARADREYRIVLSRSCDQHNADLIQLNGIPGYPAGTVFAANCTTQGERCLSCSIAAPSHDEALKQASVEGVGLPKAKDCGKLTLGRCNLVNGVWSCDDDDGQLDDCVQNIHRGPQAMPGEGDDPPGSGD